MFELNFIENSSSFIKQLEPFHAILHASKCKEPKNTKMSNLHKLLHS